MRLRTVALLCVALAAVAWLLFGIRLTLPVHADRILVVKHEHRLTLLWRGETVRTYSVALGRGGMGDKQEAGDNRVPEGTYTVVAHLPHSQFHRALRLSYPTPAQAAAARARGVQPGTDIMIHGIRNGLGWLGPLHRTVDWTRGCIALTDSQVEQVFRAVPDGTPVEIRP